MANYGFEIDHKFSGKGKMDAADDWIRANIKGLWSMEFLGMATEPDPKTQETATVFHVRFKFGRSDEMQRFRNEFINGKAPPSSAASAQAVAKKKKGFFSRLFSE